MRTMTTAAAAALATAAALTLAGCTGSSTPPVCPHTHTIGGDLVPPGYRPCILDPHTPAPAPTATATATATRTVLQPGLPARTRTTTHGTTAPRPAAPKTLTRPAPLRPAAPARGGVSLAKRSGR